MLSLLLCKTHLPAFVLSLLGLGATICLGGVHGAVATQHLYVLQGSQRSATGQQGQRQKVGPGAGQQSDGPESEPGYRDKAWGNGNQQREGSERWIRIELRLCYLTAAFLMVPVFI